MRRLLLPAKSGFYEQVIYVKGFSVFFLGVLVFAVVLLWLVRMLFSTVFLFAL